MRSQLHSHKNTRQAFTIVELLIVVVVIAILAAITIVAYNGITNQAKETTLKSDLRTAATELELANINDNTYPSSFTPKQSSDNNLNYTGGGNAYCITATNPSLPNKSFHTTQEGSIQEGDCPPQPLANGNTMQSVTQSQCQALPTFTGSNEEAIRTLTDSRGGTTRTYQVAKLADDNCWMLNNLKLGSTSGTITLTPADSNVASNFNLPQVLIPGSTSYDAPQAIGPVPGDTGAGNTNYGYLYNFPAATAGETRTSLPAGNGIAQNSICPAGWKLPTGGATGELAMLNAKMNNPSASAPSTSSGTGFYQNWQNSGPVKGVFSGYWWGSFISQGSYAYLWSRSAHATSAAYAHYAYFGASSVYPDDVIYRSYGFGVRCLLN